MNMIIKFGGSLVVIITALIASQTVQAQVSPCGCTASVGAGNVNFSTLSWVGSSCPTTLSTLYSGNLCVNLANGSNLIMDKDFEITGGLGVSNNGSSTFTVPAGTNLSVGGNLGDDSNNNVTFVINGDLEVTGTIYGKNSNAFGGSGSVTAGGLNFNQPPTCSPCNITWDVDSCVPASPFCTVVLPITLLFFNVDEHDNFVRLTWATASELNFDKFFIERSFDGKLFSEIGQIKGSGTSSRRIDYSFDDTSPIVGKSYYRLKAVDYDGTLEHFGLDVSYYEGIKSVVIYPNPSNGEQAKLMMNFHPQENSKIEIFDAVGVKRSQILITELVSELKLPSGLQAGSYLIRFTSGSYSQIIRFSVL